jgi:hypothetical protein
MEELTCPRERLKMPERSRERAIRPYTSRVATNLHNQDRHSWRLENPHSKFPWRNLPQPY